MKKFMITCLAMAFLLPAFASAEDSYCVSFPKGGNSKWSTRDNNIQVRFRYDYYKDPYKTSNKYSPKFWQSSGVVKGSKDINQKGIGYITYPYGAADLCVYNPAPNFEVRVKEARTGKMANHYDDDWKAFPTGAREVRLDVKWGGDCNKVGIFQNGRFPGTHRFEIYRRKGDHINPFGCRKK